MRGRPLQSLLLSIVILVLGAGCQQKAASDPCAGVFCCGHGTCQVSGGQASCQCETGYSATADGLHCRADNAGPCQDEDCDGHGCCQVVRNKPRCSCDADYMVDPADPQGLGCVPRRCLRMGETCSDSSQCCDNDCLKYTGQDTGYCTRRDCHDDGDCRNESADGKAMCCVDVGGEYFICMKLGSGCRCGDQTGTCGHSCSCQNDSACAPGFSCLRSGDEDTSAVCTRPCVTDADCRECRDERDPGLVFTCQPIFGGDTYCLAAQQPTCNWSGDCQGNDVCVAYPSADGLSLEGRCNRLGGLEPGDTCDSDADPNKLPFEDRCAGFYCMRGRCAEVCQLDSDCPEGMFCGAVRFRMDQAGTVTASIPMCQGGTFCQSGSDCPDDQVCMVTQISDYELVGMCDSFAGELPVGAECDDQANPRDLPPGQACAGFYCLFDHCTEVCSQDSDCGGSGGRCCLVTFGGMGPTGNDTATIPLCRWVDGSGQSCRGNNDCPPHETCQYCVTGNEQVAKFCVTENCDPDQAGNCALPGTEGCADAGGPDCWGGLCLVGLGGSFCSALCEGDSDCPAGMTCGLLGVTATQTTGACM